MSRKLLCGLLIVAATHAAKFPANWKKCPKYNNEECLKTAIRDAIVDLKDGNKDLGVNPLDPLRFTRLELNQGGSSPVAINLTFYDLDIFGTSRLKINRVKFDWDKYDLETDIEFLNGPGRLAGDYTINGKVMVLPISGKGKSELKLENLQALVKLTGNEIEKNKKKYFNVEACKFVLRISKAQLKFDNLFDGVPNLGENMNKFLNENWKEVMGELNGTISNALGQGIKEIAANFFKRVPVTSLYT